MVIIIIIVYGSGTCNCIKLTGNEVKYIIMVGNHRKGGGGCMLGATDIAKIDDHNVIFMDHSMASG